MEWREEFSVGVPALDDDHRGLFDLVTQFHDAWAAGHSADRAAAVLDVLQEYVDRHFRREEAWMEEIVFPGLADHRAGHQRIREQLADLRRRYEAGEPGVAAELIAFLHNWLEFHILGEDMAYRDHAARRAG